SGGSSLEPAERVLALRGGFVVPQRQPLHPPVRWEDPAQAQRVPNVAGSELERDPLLGGHLANRRREVLRKAGVVDLVAALLASLDGGIDKPPVRIGAVLVESHSLLL